MSNLGLQIIGALFAALFVASLVKLVIKPTPKLGGRVRPYTANARSVLGRLPDRSVLTGGEKVGAGNVLQTLLRPVVEAVLHSLMRVFGAGLNDEGLALKLRQSGAMDDVPEQDRVHEYRVRQITNAMIFGIAGGVVAAAIGLSAGLVLGLFVLGAFIGASRRAATVGKNIEQRRERMRIEIYTVNQLLAIYLRTSGSPVLAAQRLVRRGRGAVIDELNEALRLHARGLSAAKAFDRIAETTPEPFAARTYKLLATGSERGADLASALLSLSEDVRDFRRTELRRSATKRQATMLVPLLMFLAPVMMLFIAAPLPSFLLHVTN